MVVWIWCTPKICDESKNRQASNCWPQSVVAGAGTLNLATHFEMKAIATVSAEISTIGMASNDLHKSKYKRNHCRQAKVPQNLYKHGENESPAE